MRSWSLLLVMILVLPSAAAEPAARLKVLTWNVLYDDARAKERLPALLAEIARRDPDVIAAQEAMPWFVDALLRDERFAAYRAAGIGGARRGGGLLPAQPAPSGRSARAVVAEPIWPQGPVRRGDGRRRDLDHRHRASRQPEGRWPRRALQLDAIFAALKPADHALLLGDCNFGDGAPESAHIDPGYLDLWRRLHGEAAGCTWDVERNPLARANSEPGEGSGRIDRIFLRSASWQARDIAIIGDAAIAAAEGIFPSDHYGLAATIAPPP